MRVKKSRTRRGIALAKGEECVVRAFTLRGYTLATVVEIPPPSVTRPQESGLPLEPGLKAGDRPSGERPYLPDQLTLVFWIACALLILAMNAYDLIVGILGW